MKLFTIKHTRCLLSAIIALLTYSYAMADNDVYGRRIFFVETTNNVSNRFIIHGNATFSVENDSLVLRSSNMEAAYHKSRVKRFYVTKEEVLVDAINNTAIDIFSFERIDDNTIILSGLPKGDEVTVYGSNGVEYLRQRSAHEKLTLSLSSLPYGIYIITTKTAGSIKILK